MNLYIGDNMTETNRLSPITPLKPRKCAIIVGASSGIGAALARKFAHEGYSVACLARRADLLKELCDDINRTYGAPRALAYHHDVTDYDSVPALLQKILVDLGSLDVFVYNAGIQHHVGIDEFDFEKDKEMFDTITLGAVAWMNPVAIMFQNLQAGHIVAISSVAGDRGRVSAPAYNSAKAALTTFMEALRNRLTRHGVHVLTVKPGFVDTFILSSAQGKKTFMVVSPDYVAAQVYKAVRKNKQTIYTPPLWGWIMLIIRHIPSIIFRRMSF